MQPPYDQITIDRFAPISRATYFIPTAGSTTFSALANSVTGFTAQSQAIPLFKTWAIRVVKGSFALCADPNHTGFLSCVGISLGITDSTGTSYLTATGSYAGSVMGASSGVVAPWTFEEMFLGTDLSAFNTTNSVTMSIAFDVRNTDAAAHNALVQGYVLIESYVMKSTSRMRG